MNTGGKASKEIYPMLWFFKQKDNDSFDFFVLEGKSKKEIVLFVKKTKTGITYHKVQVYYPKSTFLSAASSAEALPTTARKHTSVQPARNWKYETILKAPLQSAKLCAESSFGKRERNPG